MLFLTPEFIANYLMNNLQIKLARHLLGLNQTDFAALLGWTSRRNIVNLEDENSGKKCMLQTTLAIECLIRRAGKLEEFTMLNEIQKSVQKQIEDITLLLKNDVTLSIKIIDNVCALDFKDYAKKEEWNDLGNEFEITFEDSNNVIVSKEDFIKYQFQYTDFALEIEKKFSDYIDELRDLQQDAARELLEI